MVVSFPFTSRGAASKSGRTEALIFVYAPPLNVLRIESLSVLKRQVVSITGCKGNQVDYTSVCSLSINMLVSYTTCPEPSTSEAGFKSADKMFNLDGSFV